jgi:hypothetical protein
MIDLRPKLPLKWNEPAAVRRREWAAAISKERGVILLISTAAILLLRVISRNPKSPSWPVSVLIAIGGGAFFGIFMPWFVGLFPSQILVSVKGINRNAPACGGSSGSCRLNSGNGRSSGVTNLQRSIYPAARFAPWSCGELPAVWPPSVLRKKHLKKQ